MNWGRVVGKPPNTLHCNVSYNCSPFILSVSPSLCPSLGSSLLGFPSLSFTPYGGNPHSLTLGTNPHTICFLMSLDLEEPTLYPVPSELVPLWQEVRQLNKVLENRLNCFYCGELATCEDHVIPHSMRYAMGINRRDYGTDTLPACHECNGLLGSNVFDTLTERKTYLDTALRKRYANELHYKPWSQAELEELGYSLRDRCAALTAIHLRIVDRLRVLQGCAAPMVESPKAEPRPKRKTSLSPIDPFPMSLPKSYKVRVGKKTGTRWTQDVNGQWECELVANR